MRIKTNDLTGQRLAWAVATAAKLPRVGVLRGKVVQGVIGQGLVPYDPTTNWATAGPLFERFGVDASAGLVEGCRALVRSKFPLAVEVPDDLVP